MVEKNDRIRYLENHVTCELLKLNGLRGPESINQWERYLESIEDLNNAKREGLNAKIHIME